MKHRAVPARWRALCSAAALALATALVAEPCRAIVFTTDVDPNFNSTAPTGVYANSGWQYQGRTENNFVGTPIAPRYFITAEHIGPNAQTTFSFNGHTYTTDAYFDDPNSDLRIWRVTEDFPIYAPLYTKGDEVGKELTVFGRGPAHGDELPGHGWKWGTLVTTLRWGTNTVAEITTEPGFGQMLRATFDLGVSATEAMLTVRDSSGGVFIKDTDGVWKLAGINFAVSGPYKETLMGQAFDAALYNQDGYYALQPDGSYALATGPGSFLATRISSNIPFIQQITGVPEPSAGLLALSGLALWAGFRRGRRATDAVESRTA